ncbi:MAG: hypothetical protein KJZ86_16145 [Caldilineaceae bacterium]|nr:hypothetical protein [Caldilineaceae bacterium]HRJ40879.1 hypothetical protein [Caldilineaceae bacterium]
MKRLLILSALIFVGALGWRIGSAMSSDAIGIAVGVVFGVLASIPAALLLLVAGRRNERRQEWEGDGPRGRNGQQPRGQYDGYPPVVIMTPPSMPMPPGQANQFAGYYGGQNGSYLSQPNQMALPGPAGGQMPSQRQFRVVGEEEEWVEEW